MIRDLLPSDCRHTLQFAVTKAVRLEVDAQDSPLLRAMAASGQPTGGDEIMVRGMGVPYNKYSSPLPNSNQCEVFLPGCFGASLNGDIRACFNSADCILGRTRAGTARVWSQADGLYFEAIAPHTQWATDLLASMDRGDISGGGIWCDIVRSHLEFKFGQHLRIIEAANLRAVAVVSFSAFDESSVQVRRSGTQEIAAGLPYSPDPRMEAL